MYYCTLKAAWRELQKYKSDHDDIFTGDSIREWSKDFHNKYKVANGHTEFRKMLISPY